MEFNDPGFFALIRIRIKAWLAAWLFGDTPMIWTSKGNVPERDLQRWEQWIENENETTLVVVHMTHDGEEVKRSPHVRLKQSNVIGAEQALMA